MFDILIFKAAFQDLDDPRARNVTYPLINILMMAFVGKICGADDWEGISEVCAQKKEMLSRFLEFNGIPSPDTFERVFSMLDPDAFASCLQRWALLVTGSLKGVHLAGDGKAQRASYSKALSQDFFMGTSLFLVEQGLFLAVTGDRGACETQDMKTLLEPLDLHGAYITLDALHTSTTTTSLLAKKGADWVLPLKENCPARLAEVIELFETSAHDQGHRHQETNKGHGRVEERQGWSLDLVGDWFGNQGDWGNLKGFVMLERKRWTQTTDESSHEVHYFLSSFAAEELELQMRLIRGHWAIENNGHWHLDVLLDEDRSRARRENAAANMATLKRFILNLLKKTKVGPTALKRKRLRAALDDSYCLRVLNSL